MPRAVLDKFCIGDVAAEPGECAAVQYQQPAEQQQFYTVLRQRVEKYFRKNEVCECPLLDDLGLFLCPCFLSLGHYLARLTRTVLLQLSSRASVDMYVKTALILSGLVVSFYGTFFCFSNFWVSVSAIVQIKALCHQYFPHL